MTEVYLIQESRGETIHIIPVSRCSIEIDKERMVKVTSTDIGSKTIIFKLDHTTGGTIRIEESAARAYFLAKKMIHDE